MTLSCRRMIRNGRMLQLVVIGYVMIIFVGSSSAQDSNDAFVWKLESSEGNWADGANWTPPGPPDSGHSAVIGGGTCVVDGNYVAECLNLYLGGGTIVQTGGDLIVDRDVYAGYGNNSGVFSQADGNTLIGASLLVGWGLQGNKSGSFTARYGTVVVAGDVWVGDPNADPNQGSNPATLTIGSGQILDGNAVLKVGGDIHVRQRPAFPLSVAYFWEVRSLDPGRALRLFNDGWVIFDNDSNYNYSFDKIVTTEPNSLGRFVITDRCIVSVNQINQRYVEINGGGWWSCNLNILGTPEAYESNIIDGMVISDN